MGDAMSNAGDDEMRCRRVTVEDGKQWGCRQWREYGSDFCRLHQDGDSMTTKKKTTKKSLVSTLIAEGSRFGALRWEFPPEAIQDIREAKAVNDGKEHFISASRLARALKKAYQIPVNPNTIAKRIREMHGGRW